MKLLGDRYELIGAAVAFLIVGPVFWMLVDQSPPITVDQVQIDQKTVVRGAPLEVKYKATFHRRCSGSGQRVFVDKIGVITTISPYTFRNGIGWDDRPVPLEVEKWTPPIHAPVPPRAEPGPARYQNITHFYCNYLQKAFGKKWPWLSITFRYPVVDFTISDAPAVKSEPSTSLFAPMKQDENIDEVLTDEAPPPPLNRDAKQ